MICVGYTIDMFLEVKVHIGEQMSLTASCMFTSY